MMRLHNRQVKAAFWQDSELIQSLNRDGRLFYEGLWQLADDSGCLEDDSFAFKIHLFPGDIDITPDILLQYRDRLVQIGKLIPYEVEGKPCLFLKNFHKHQALDSPSSPGVPLPPWIRWETYKSNPRAGKYAIEDYKGYIRETILQNADDCLTVPLQNPSNQNQNLNQNLNQNIKDMSAPDGADTSEEAPAEKPVNGGAQNKPGKGDYTPDFEKFWLNYPRKVEKKSAYRTWNILLKKKVSPGDIIQSAINYSRYCSANKTDTRFIKHPATFLGPDKPYEDFKNGSLEMSDRSVPKNLATALELVRKAESECGGETNSIW